MTILYIVIAVVVILVIWAIASYNGFVTRTQRAKEALSDIAVQEKRRYDLIPNLVESVKGYAAHEKSVFENVTAARSAVMNAAPAQKAAAENMLTGALKSLFAVAEAYPDLKANQNFLQLQQELADTEDKIQASRRFYNATVQDLTTAMQSFPGNVIASMFHFAPMTMYELTSAAEAEPVKVQF